MRPIVQTLLTLSVLTTAACDGAEAPSTHRTLDGIEVQTFTDDGTVEVVVHDDAGTLLHDAVHEVEQSQTPAATDGFTAQTQAQRATPQCQDIGGGWDYCADGDGWCLAQGPSVCGHDWICCDWGGDCESRDDVCW